LPKRGNRNNYYCPSLIRRILFFLLFAFAMVSGVVANHIFVNDTIKLHQKVYVGDNLAPGDTLFLESGHRDQLLLKNIVGELYQPITIINTTGYVEIETDSGMYGIAIRASRYLKLSGTGDEHHKRGIVIKRVGRKNGVGVTFEKLTSDFEMDHLEISNISFAAVIAKSDPDSSLKSSRDSFLLSNAIFHDNYIHDIEAGEAFYIGHSKYKTGAIVHRNGHDTVVMPHLLKNVKVYNNLIENTGFDGIQVSSANEDCAIYNNEIHYDSQAEHYGQMSGIIMGGGSRCDCYNNKIYDGKGTGILMFGLGNTKIYNNLIIAAGANYQVADTSILQHGILVSDKSMEDSSFVHVLNNTIVDPKSDGIRFTSSKSLHNKIFNNLIAEPGSFSTYEWDNTAYSTRDAYIYISNFSRGHVDTTRNIGYRREQDAPFKRGVDGEYYELKDSCYLVDVGEDLSGLHIRTDIDGNKRPTGMGYDIGAYESSFTNYDSYPLDISIVNVYPNPAINHTNIKYEIERDGLVSLLIIDIHGRVVKVLVQILQYRGTYTVKLNTRDLSNRMLFVYFDFEGEINVQKLMIIENSL
jgi:hypothetical protein